MEQRRWRSMRSLLNRTLDVPTCEREAFLAIACGEDLDLLSNVWELLKAYETADHDFFEQGAGAKIYIIDRRSRLH